MNEISYEFAGFTLWPERRTLEVRGSQVKLGSREFDILLTLIEREGEVVSTPDLLRLVWPNENVGAAIVRVRIALLRKALGDPALAKRLIATVVDGGYTFLGGAVLRSSANAASAASKPSVPAALSPIIGRERMLAQLDRAIGRQRLISIVGPSGIGKTTIAMEIGRRVADRFEDVVFVDLAAVAREEMVPTEIALALGIGIHPVDPVLSIASYLRERRVLMILDTCEHVLSAVASMSSRLLTSVRHLTTICTSNGPLDVTGESVFRVDPLETPPSGVALTVGAAMGYPAIELFVDRASASADSFVLADTNVQGVADLCRWLEGVPLAIDLAASRVPEFGLAGVVSRMQDRFSLLNRGRRTATPRHQSLHNALHWSYASLSEQERRVFRALSIFAGNFSPTSAVGLIRANGQDAQFLLDKLVAKSLVFKGDINGFTYHRMLNMTREYGREMLDEARETRSASALHAQDALAVLQIAKSLSAQPTAECRSRLAQRLGDIRRALEWCFSEDGDARCGIQLTADAETVFVPRGLGQEYFHWVKRAIEANEAQSAPSREAAVKLFAAFGRLASDADAKGPARERRTAVSDDSGVDAAERFPILW